MATKSKSDYALVGSIIAIVIAVCSLVYCAPPILEMLADSVERSNRAISYFTRLVRGSV